MKKGQAAINLNDSSFKASHLKGQAAMEYLMTYGWAILVIVIVLAALYFWLPKTQESCLFQEPGFLCEGKPQVYKEGTNLYLSVKVSNKMGEQVKDASVLCTTLAPTELTASDIGTDGDLVINAGETKSLLAIECTEDGDNLGGLYTVGSGFQGYIAIAYSLSSDADPDVKHVAFATVSGTVLEK